MTNRSVDPSIAAAVEARGGFDTHAIAERLRAAGTWTESETNVVLAANLYAMKKCSFGRAMEMAGMQLFDFMTRVNAMGIPVRGDETGDEPGNGEVP